MMCIHHITQNKSLGREDDIMRNNTTLSLVDIPWPINILKVNQMINKMQSGEQLTVILKDFDAKESLVILLRTLSDLKFDLFESKGCYQLNIKKDDVS